MWLKIKNRSHSYNINGPRTRQEPKYTKPKVCLSIMMAKCINPFMTEAVIM